MAEFRRNHAKGGRGPIQMTRMVMLVGVMLAIVVLALRLSKVSFDDESPAAMAEGILVASSTSGNVINHSHYSLSYVEAHEQPEWVSYTLTREQLNAPRVPRTDYFYADDAVDTYSATYKDYSSSGYTRGHLAPAADMAFDSAAMQESFFMSNVSPQIRAFNGGVWRELEEQTRDWARRFKRIHVSTGPVLNLQVKERIGKNRVSVPEFFYKVLLDLDDPEQKGIAFVIPNARTEQPLAEYAVSIDSVEVLTGLNFFKDANVDHLEADFDIDLWNINRNRYRMRVDVWNHR